MMIPARPKRIVCGLAEENFPSGRQTDFPEGEIS
jgi:hypothetical protein